MVSMAQQFRLGQTQRCPLSRAVSQKVVVGLPALHLAKRTKTSAFFGKNAEALTSETNASQMSTPALASSMQDLSQQTSVAGGFHQEVVSALHMSSPANVIYTTQTRFTTLDRPALGPGQALGFVLAAAGVYVAMLISAFFYGKDEKKLNWKQNKFQGRTFKTFTAKARSLPHPRVLLSKRPYVQQRAASEQSASAVGSPFQAEALPRPCPVPRCPLKCCWIHTAPPPPPHFRTTVSQLYLPPNRNSRFKQGHLATR